MSWISKKQGSTFAKTGSEQANISPFTGIFNILSNPCLSFARFADLYTNFMSPCDDISDENLTP